MHAFPAHENVPLFFSAAFIPPCPHLQFLLIVESLCLPCTLALSGNDVNRVKRFQGSRGRKTLRDFGVWLVEKCNEENTLTRPAFLCRLLPCVAPSVQCRHKLADALVYSFSSTPFRWCSAPSGQPSSTL